MLRDFLDRFGLGEVFAHICPGFVVILSSLLWWRPDSDSVLFKSTAGAVVVLLLLSYTVGLVVASYLSIAEGRYLLARHRFRKQGWLRRIPTGFVLLGCRFAAGKPDATLVDWATAIASTLRDLGAPIGLAQHIKSSERFGVFQAIARGRGMDDVIEEAQGYRRRATFALGVGVALLATAGQMLLRLVLSQALDTSPAIWPEIHEPALLAGATITAWTAVELRRVGVRMLAMEAYISAFIAHELSRKRHNDESSGQSVKNPASVTPSGP